MNREKQTGLLSSSQLNMVYAIGGAAAFLITFVILGGVLFYTVQGLTDPFLIRLPWIVWLTGIVLALFWFMHCLRMDQHHVRQIEYEQAQAQNYATRAAAKAQLVLAHGQAQGYAPKPLAITQEALPLLQDSEIRTEEIPHPRGGYFTLPMSSLQALIEAYPKTSRQDLTPSVVSGAAEHRMLIAAAEYYGWIGKPRDNGAAGQGVQAKWIKPIEQAREMFAAMYAHAEMQARLRATNTQSQLPRPARTSDGLIVPTRVPPPIKVQNYE